jgi:hypothetical protein
VWQSGRRACERQKNKWFYSAWNTRVPKGWGRDCASQTERMMQHVSQSVCECDMLLLSIMQHCHSLKLKPSHATRAHKTDIHMMFYSDNRKVKIPSTVI